MKAMSTLTSSDYAALLAETQPSVPKDARENERLIALLEELAFKKRPTAAERKLIALLTILVEDFEKREFPLTPAPPSAIVAEFMEAHGLKQRDLVEAGIFETASVASEVLSGKRQLTKEHIRRLSKRFNVSPEVFF